MLDDSFNNTFATNYITIAYILYVTVSNNAAIVVFMKGYYFT